LWRLVGELSALRETFPLGLPPRLLVLGTGGTGKTVLTKQVVVDLCSEMLGSEGSPGEQGPDKMQGRQG
jgi:Cdc6-like AAA superfamily ATPase